MLGAFLGGLFSTVNTFVQGHQARSEANRARQLRKEEEERRRLESLPSFNPVVAETPMVHPSMGVPQLPKFRFETDASQYALENMYKPR